MQDLRDAIRALRFAPGFTTVALLVLTLGISSSTVVFSVVDTIVIRRLPFEAPDRLVTIAETTPNGPSNNIAPEEFRVWRSLDVFSGLAALGGARKSACEWHSVPTRRRFSVWSSAGRLSTWRPA
jgi:hypothetical protein